MPAWTVEQVMALAPDAASASAGQGLASARKWAGLGRSERAVWGLAQGSGKDPYQCRVDLSEPAFKCSCPSRKFPCKHGLGLMLLFVKESGTFAGVTEPGWVSDWIAGRAERAENKEKAKAAAEKPVDAEAQAKRAAQREERVREGIAGCRVWLEDVLRRELAAAQAESGAVWDRMAARMVDAQAPGLGAYVRRIPELLASGAGWEVRTLDHLGRLHLLLRAGDRVAELPPDVAGDARTALGWTQAKEEALASAGVRDEWLVPGQVVEEEERLRSRRTWLIGRESRRPALLLEFAAGATPFDTSLVVGTRFEGELAFYPGRLPLRALVKSRSEARPVEDCAATAEASIEAALGKGAAALGANPWLARWPLFLSGVRIAPDHGAWYLVDAADAALPLRPLFTGGPLFWRLLSASGGGPMVVLAEWDGEWALPLGAIVAGRHVDLALRGAA